MFRPKTFSETIRPVLLLNILFGTGSFVVSKKQKVSKYVESVYTVVAWISFNVVLMMQLVYRNAVLPKTIGVNKIVIALWSTIMYATVTVLIFITKFKMKSTQDLIEAVDQIDQKMQSIGLPSQYPIQYKHQMYYIGCWLAHVTMSWIVTLIFRINPNAPIVDRIILTIGLNHIQTILTVVQLSFTLWIGHIRMKFTQLNHLLEEMIEMTDQSGPKQFLEVHNSQVQKRRRQDVHAVKGNVDTITKAKNYHLELIAITRRLNKFYGMQLLLTTLNWLLTTVTLLYMFNFCIWQPLSRAETFEELGAVIIWIILNMLRMIHLYSNCVQTSNEAGKAGFLLCRLYNSSTSIEFRAEVQNFTHQVQENPLVLNVCGLVDIDRTFLTSDIFQVMGSIFAYLLVIVQLAFTPVNNRRNIAANATDVNVTANYT
ncbi:uncharacterized protein LOC143215153 [Lasioglossum baleicum]|uniref:uncharacterized protein LOC143215153 n=1 Tax=Lasioglossum baleicum TaxID=434251 RepID=UPI003FCC3BD2